MFHFGEENPRGRKRKIQRRTRGKKIRKKYLASKRKNYRIKNIEKSY